MSRSKKSSPTKPVILSAEESMIPRDSPELIMVGLGGSAGGVPVLKKFFAAMPVDSGLVFVVILHLAPDHSSCLSEILQVVTSMPVTMVEDKVHVQANRVYVIPPGKTVSSDGGQLLLSDLETTPGRRVTVDLFFRSLGQTHGRNSVAIVLSGAASDGASGIKRVKESGGLTIAQDPKEAEQPGMPDSAIATGMVDWVLKVEEIPAKLREYLEVRSKVVLPDEEGPHPSELPNISEAEIETALREVLAYLKIRTGRDFLYYKRATILRRIARRMQVNVMADLPAYLTYLQTHAGEANALLQDLLVAVTNFFRDPEAFAALEKMIPALFKDKGVGDVVRVWVAACATGEEAYSIAILLSEYARSMAAPPQIQIFATDLDEEVIQVARAGIYPESISTDVSEERLRSFFFVEPHGYRVRREIREMVLFAAHDLLQDSPFSRLDLVSCRNLLIYLNRDAQKRALDIFHFALRPGGLLFLGTSESVDEGTVHLEAYDKKHRLYGKVPGPGVALPVLSGPSTIARALAIQGRGRYRPPNLPKGTLPDLKNAGLYSAADDSGDDVSWNELHYKLIEHFSEPSILINGMHDVVHVSESAGRFLQFPGGEPTRSILRLVHPMLRLELRAALYSAAGESVAAAFAIPCDLNGVKCLVDLRVVAAGDVAPNYHLIFFSAKSTSRFELPRPQKKRVTDAISLQLERELESTKTNLRQTIEQAEASNEEQKASNEELQAINEELRSTTEELETSREELQSINEELTTVNQELKHNLDQLSMANNDLQNLMAATAIATVFLDENLRIKLYTPSALALFNFIPADVGRPLVDITHRMKYPEIMEDAQNALKDLKPLEREITTDDCFYLVRAVPYLSPDHRPAGVVFTLLDISTRKRSEIALRQAKEMAEAANGSKDRFLAVLSHELRTPLTPVLLVVASLEHNSNLPSEVKEDLAMIKRNVTLETKLIDDLLDFNRLVNTQLTLETEAAELNAIVRYVLTMTGGNIEEHSLTLEVNLHDDAGCITADPTRFQQVIWNVINNAIKFTPRGGSIRISTRRIGSERCELRIADNGIGIAQGALSEIFHPFQQGGENITRRFGGMGLGLGICKALMELHGGTIRAESEGLGKGAAFIIEMPVVEKSVGAITSGFS